MNLTTFKARRLLALPRMLGSAPGYLFTTWRVECARCGRRGLVLFQLGR